jgi:hypothetical protein
MTVARAPGALVEHPEGAIGHPALADLVVGDELRFGFLARRPALWNRLGFEGTGFFRVSWIRIGVARSRFAAAQAVACAAPA